MAKRKEPLSKLPKRRLLASVKHDIRAALREHIKGLRKPVQS